MTMQANLVRPCDYLPTLSKQLQAFLAQHLFRSEQTLCSAEDVTQDVMVVAWKKYGDKQLANGNAMKAFCFTTAKNLALNANRKGNRRSKHASALAMIRGAFILLLVFSITIPTTVFEILGPLSGGPGDKPLATSKQTGRYVTNLIFVIIGAFLILTPKVGAIRMIADLGAAIVDRARVAIRWMQLQAHQAMNLLRI